MDAAISLRELFPRGRFIGGEDVLVTRLVSDAGDCQPGDVLVVLADCDDPTAAGCQALARGAVGVLTEQLLPIPLPQCIVKDVQHAAVRVSHALAGDPAEGLFVIGIVGGDGKTTTALLTAGLLRGAGYRTAYETDLGCSDGVLQQVCEERHTGVCSFVDFLSDARDAGCATAVVELSEDFVHSPAMHHLVLDMVVVLGGSNRQGRQRGLPCTVELALQQLREGGVAVVNADSTAAMAAADRASVATLTYGLRREALVTAKVFDQQPGETTLAVTAGDVTAMMETQLTGPALASCQLAAVAVGTLLEQPLPQVIEVLRQVRCVPGRMQRVSSFNAPSVVLDRAGSARRLSAVLRGLKRETRGGKLWLVAAITEGIDAEELAACGRLGEKLADRTVVTSGSSEKRGFLAAAHDWLDGVQRPSAPRLIADRETALRWVMEHAGAEDTILVAGGWPTGMPLLERSSLEAEVELISLLQSQSAENEGHNGEEPLILPHPSLLSLGE